ncbi:caspase family protein [Streptomyces sp. NPDC004012]
MPNADQSCALLIGVSDYTYLEGLPAVRNNLSALSSLLTGKESWALAQESCVVMDNPTTSAQVMTLLREASEHASDALLVYYAGHGLVDRKGELFLGLPESQHGWADTGVPYEWVRSAILDGKARRRIVVLDCCFSGRALGAMTSANPLADQAEVEGSIAITASSESRVALAVPGEPYTAFTAEILELIGRGIPEGPSLLSWDAVYQNVRRALHAKGRPIPQKRDRNGAGQLAAAVNRAFSSSQMKGGGEGVSAGRSSWVPGRNITRNFTPRERYAREESYRLAVAGRLIAIFPDLTVSFVDMSADAGTHVSIRLGSRPNLIMDLILLSSPIESAEELHVIVDPYRRGPRYAPAIFVSPSFPDQFSVDSEHIFIAPWDGTAWDDSLRHAVECAREWILHTMLGDPG